MTFTAYLRPAPGEPWQCLFTLGCEHDDIRDDCWEAARRIRDGMARRGRFILARSSLVVLPAGVVPYGTGARKR